MQGWTTPADARQQVQRLWDRGELLLSVLDSMADMDEVDGGISSVVFPLRLKLKKPSSQDVGNFFVEVRSWIQALSNLRHTRLELVETRHPQLGKNEIPQSLWIDSLDDALAFIGKRDDSRQFNVQVTELLASDGLLLDWVRRRPVKVLELTPVWSRLLRVHDHIVKRSGNALYLRQLSVEGVDTKFIETHRGVLAEWLDLTLPSSNIDESYRGSRGFARRYGFKDKPIRLRLRSLDRSQPLLGHIGSSAGGAGSSGDTDDVIALADITLDLDVIRSLDPSQSCVVITENEVNYLALPNWDNTIAVFGSGYGLQSLGEIDWLKRRDVWYWGDIDTHGFAILNELRSQLPSVRSLLMDRDTLMEHELLWGSESTPTNRRLEHLHDHEIELYRDIIEHRYRHCLRLEQEQIKYEWVLSRLEGVLS